jgi:oxygen-independent coproporphyrinogen-3 oxidase
MTEDRLLLTPAVLAEDALVFGLRLNQGVDLAALSAACPDATWAAVRELLDHLAADGRAECTGPQVRLTASGRLVADSVGAEIIALFRRGPG